jgi:toxin ParE1/3/4
MSNNYNAKFYLKGHARSDITQIRKYTIKNWGDAQWEIYKQSLLQRFQNLANNPNIGIIIDEISPNAVRFPLNDHVIYYLRRQKDIVIVGVLSTSMSPEKHLRRKQDVINETDS